MFVTLTMATLGEVTTGLRSHEERLQGHDARHANMEQRTAALESELNRKFVGIMWQSGEKKDGLKIKEGKDNTPGDFSSDREKFRGRSHQMYVWAIAIYPESGRNLSKMRQNSRQSSTRTGTLTTLHTLTEKSSV